MPLPAAAHPQMAAVPCLHCSIVRGNLQGQIMCSSSRLSLLLTHCWGCNPSRLTHPAIPLINTSQGVFCCLLYWKHPVGFHTVICVFRKMWCCRFCRSAAAFQAWHQLVTQSMSLHQASSRLAVQLQQRSMHHCLQAWQVHTLQKQAHRRLLVRLLRLKAQSRLSGTFQAWRGYVANFRYRPILSSLLSGTIQHAS